MTVSVYTTDEKEKRRFRKTERKATGSWHETKWLLRLNTLAFLVFATVSVYVARHAAQHFQVVVCAALFFLALSFPLRWLANADINDVFMKRLDETVAYMENGDLIYSYRVESKKRLVTTVVLKMRYADMTNISRERRTDQSTNLMIFSGRFSKTITEEGTIVDNLASAVRSKEPANLEGAIFCPAYITPNPSMSRILNQYLSD